ncbi:MAG: class I SAM-dependent methyltransferase [Theionarchaea archaeon]|nr:class I SAM-dependent methyltransferase [Theionarchaea archaeon]
MSSKGKVRSDYDASAFCYNKRYKSIQWEKYQIMLRDIELQGILLDLGCGTGLLGSFLKKEVVGVDISREMLLKAHHLRVQADMDLLPFQSSVFDAVLSFTALQNLPSLDHIFEEVWRVLKPGRPFIFTILSKKFSPQVSAMATIHFEILQMRECGEDTGFICRKSKEAL